MVAHRTVKMRKDDLKVSAITLPDSKKYFEEIPLDKLPPNWTTMKDHSLLQTLGGDWYHSKQKQFSLFTR